MGPSEGAGILTGALDLGFKLAPVIGKQALKAGRYYASEALRNSELQQKAIDFALEKAKPAISKVGKEGLMQLSTKIRPKRKDGKRLHKTDIKGLDCGSGLIESGVAGSPWKVDLKKGSELLTDPNLFKTPNKKEITDIKERIKFYKEQYKLAKAKGYKGSYSSFVQEKGWASKPTFTFPGFGGAIDIHKAIGKLPKPKSGWTLPGHNYTGPYNPLDEQLKYDPETGQIFEIYQQPTGKTDAISMQHDVDYSVCGDDR